MTEELSSSLDALRLDRSDEGEPMRRRRRWPWVVGALVILAIVFAVAQRAPVVRTAVAAKAAATDRGPVPVLNASGYVVARRQATISSKITGRVVDVRVDEGMKVEEGQILARLDDAEAQRALALTEAQRQAAHRALGETEARLTLARADHARVVKLASDGVSSQADVDAATADESAYAARLLQQRDEVTVAERQVAVARQNLENTVIRAPFSGVAISKNAQPGEMISPVSAGGGFTRTGITTVVDMSSLEIEVDVNESYIQRVHSGQPVEARLNAYPSWKIPAHVITTIPAADRDKATVRVRIAFAALDPRILPDMGVKVTFLGAAGAEGAPEYALVPSTAVRHEKQQSVVYVASGGKLSRREVEVGKREGDQVEVLSGVAPGETVVTSGPAKLADGEAVRARTGS